MMSDSSKKDQIQPQNKLVMFEDKKIRRIFHDGEWFFSIIDILEVLTATPNPVDPEKL